MRFQLFPLVLAVFTSHLVYSLPHSTKAEGHLSVREPSLDGLRLDQPNAIVKRDAAGIAACQTTYNTCINRADTYRDTRERDEARTQCWETLIACVRGKLNDGSRAISAKVAKDAMCPICTDQMYGGERTAQLKCGHNKFHINCLGVWLASEKTCPMCRTNLYKN